MQPSPSISPPSASPLRRAARILYVGGALLLSGALLLLHTRLYAPPGGAYGGATVGPDVVAQLHYLGPALRDGAGEDMQALFPEGYFFSHALYGLAWADVGRRAAVGSPGYAEALREARWALARVDSPAGRAVFSPALDPPYGVFYVGWSNRLRGAVLQLQPAGARDAGEVARFEAECAALAAAFAAYPSPFLPAYPGQAWPVDSTVAIAALSLHDRMLPPRYTATIATWRAAAQARLDPASGLLPHRVGVTTGEGLEGARGSSQSIIQRFLPEIDPAWSADQYGRFRAQFVTSVAGLPGVREYPLGVDGQGDVDSGPLLAGVSVSASAVTLGAALVHGDHALADPLLHTGEFLGLPLEWGGAKRYAGGVLPAGDAFLVWAKSTLPPNPAPPDGPLPPVVAEGWRIPLHLGALALLALVWLPVWGPRLRRRGQARSGR